MNHEQYEILKKIKEKIDSNKKEIKRTINNDSDLPDQRAFNETTNQFFQAYRLNDQLEARKKAYEEELRKVSEEIREMSCLIQLLQNQLVFYASGVMEDLEDLE